MKFVVFDKDGTLVAPASGAEFVDHPLDQVLLRGVAKRLRALSRFAHISIVSNQAGVAAGYKTLSSAIEEMRYCLGLTGITEGYFCPDFEGLECWRITYCQAAKDFLDPEHLTLADFANSGEDIQSFRKPGPGMLQVARLYASLSFGFPAVESCVFIGDRAEDQAAAAAAGFRFIAADLWRRSGI
jgi:D-glycero-D-manno-heptose 1,7-bisphosphate phosphatase